MLKLSRRFVLNPLKVASEYPERRFNRELCFKNEQQIKTLNTFSPIKNDRVRLSFFQKKYIHSGYTLRKVRKLTEEEHDEKRSLLYYGEFQKFEKKDKKAFNEVVRLYQQNVGKRTSHVDFIKAALKHMKEFGVHRDLESYKKILDVFPKGPYVATNRFAAAGMHYPRQQFVTLDLLDQMENNGVIPDVELFNMLWHIFGKMSAPYIRCGRMFYWVLKVQNKSPFLLPRPLPSDPQELAKLAIQQITSVDLQTEISVYQTDILQESIDKTWIVSGQSPKQKNLLKKHAKDVPVIVEGGDLVWLRQHSISYFVLKADGEPLPYEITEDLDDISNLKLKFFNPNYVVKEKDTRTVHEQDDGIIYAVCATGTSSRDSLLSWIRILQNSGNPILADIPVLFRFKKPESLPAVTTDEIVAQA